MSNHTKTTKFSAQEIAAARAICPLGFEPAGTLEKTLDDMIARRMMNTGETEEQAAKHIADYLTKFLKGL
jgi:hypothetical protein